MRKLTPQEKKALSYEKDRRNVYGESPHGARKSIPLRKRLRNRANRRQQEQQLAVANVAIDDETAEQIEARLSHKAPKGWKKIPDAPLEQVIEKKQRRRRITELQGRRRAAKKKVVDD